MNASWTENEHGSFVPFTLFEPGADGKNISWHQAYGGKAHVDSKNFPAIEG